MPQVIVNVCGGHRGGWGTHVPCSNGNLNQIMLGSDYEISRVSSVMFSSL